MSDSPTAAPHRFETNPHRAFLALTLPVLVSLVAEPLTGLVDTFFVARLGAPQLAGLGIGVTLLSSVFWVFNFLGISTQTEVGQAYGEGQLARAGSLVKLALSVAFALGVMLALAMFPFAEALAGLLGGQGETSQAASLYLRVRLLGGPAVLLMTVAFHALRGLQDMRTPLWIALGTNAVNVVLDPLLIFGAGPLPALGVGGAAAASTGAQWLGALWALQRVRRALPLTGAVPWSEAGRLFVIGRDMVTRTGSLLFFLALATRAANQLGPEAGAAHQAARQVWSFTAFLLDAYASAAQSLLAYFLASGRRVVARRVAWVGSVWALGTGAVLMVLMLASEAQVARAFVPPEAHAVFAAAWLWAAYSQPINALSFVTDGIHWGTGEYAYLRNGMLLALLAGSAGLWASARFDAGLGGVWAATALWIGVRAAVGVVRVWPGSANAPLGHAGKSAA